MEDFINTTSTVPLSSVPIQFIVKIVAAPTCLNPPEIIPYGPSCIQLRVGETFKTSLFALNHCGSNVRILDIASVSFPGMQQNNVQQVNSTLFYKNLTWTPTIDQLGYQIMCTVAVNR